MYKTAFFITHTSSNQPEQNADTKSQDEVEDAILDSFAIAYMSHEFEPDCGVVPANIKTIWKTIAFYLNFKNKTIQINHACCAGHHAKICQL